jgi:Fe-S cluster assembly protein SufD
MSALTEPNWLAARRERGAALSLELPLPDARTAGWEFTDIRNLDLEAYPAAEPAADALEAASGLFDGLDRADLVDLPDGVIVAPLAIAAEEHRDLVERHLGTIVATDDAFVARNEAAWGAGVFVYVPQGVELEKPIGINVVQDAELTQLNWRTLVVLEEGARAEVWEQYLSADPELDGLLNTVVELAIGDNAHLRYVCGQDLSERSWIFGSQRAEVQRDGSLDWVALGFGSGRGKVRMETKLAGPGSSAKVTGAYAGHARQHLDFDTTQEHAAANTFSDLAFRGVLEDRANAVWRGMIRVDPGAQQTDAFQESRNLLLSRRAHADAIPGLEIEANDVRCTHAAAIAQVDQEQLFYLMARGLPRDAAHRLIVEGFLQALVERFEEGPVREVLGQALAHRLESVLAD